MAELKKTSNGVERPLILEITDAKNETVEAINDIIKKHHLPMFFMEIIVSDIYRQIAAGAQQEVTLLKSNETNKENKNNDTNH